MPVLAEDILMEWSGVEWRVKWFNTNVCTLGIRQTYVWNDWGESNTENIFTNHVCRTIKKTIKN